MKELVESEMKLVAGGHGGEHTENELAWEEFARASDPEGRDWHCEITTTDGGTETVRCSPVGGSFSSPKTVGG